MFQQFKSIFPSTSLNIRSLSESVGINDTEWNRGVERLEALKSEFQNLNSIFLSRQNSTDSIPTTPNQSSITELKVTTQVIEKIHQGWNTIHENNRDNFQKAKTVDVLLRQLQSTGQAHYTVCEQMENVSTDMKDMQSNLNQIQNSTAQLMKVLCNLEQQIDDISVDHEKREFELWKETKELELMEEMKIKRGLLREKESRLKEQYEEYDTIQKQKKVELYEANFNAELEEYKRKRENEVSSLYSGNNNVDTVTTSLDQLQLENDKGKGDLDQFLSDQEEEQVSKEEEEQVQKKEKKKKKKTSKVKPVIKQPISSDEEDDRRVEILQDEDYQDF
ncbi:hypothetical protein INT48_008517 [Thamnidium elegans]|uniref:Uncharacterized protein n=1 Tax=Thamnidium elegans TaxID=101142 RepID=A0A8H7VV47_9FUNG|nr:hypothetical protein INT48_008517 [Thamnidium elegans]